MTPLYFIGICLARFVFKLFYRMKVYGRIHYRKEGAILAPNHASYLDPPIVAAASVGSVHFLARETLFRSWFGKLITALNAHPVQDQANNITVIKTLCGLLKKGYKVIFFPEGARSQDNVLSPIKPGIGMLVLLSKTAVIPVHIHGTFDIWPRTQKRPRLFGKTAVIFGSPIDWKDYVGVEKSTARTLIVERLEKSLEELRTWYEAGARGTPP